MRGRERADAGALSCHISISEGIAEKSVRKLKGWFSTDRQTQGLMFNEKEGKKKTLLFSSFLLLIFCFSSAALSQNTS